MADDTRSSEPADARSATSLDRLGTRIRIPKSSELVAAQLRRQIVRGDLAEGDELPPEAVLQEVFGVSRPTLREAIRILESERLVVVRRGARGGARVHAPDGKLAARYVGLVLEHRGGTLADVYEARTVIEVDAVRRLAARRTKADLAALRSAVLPMAGLVDDVARFALGSGSFHALIVSLTGNRTLAVLDDVLNDIIVRAADSFASQTDAGRRDTPGSHREHEELIELVHAKEVEAAAAHWRAHCERVARIVLSGPGAKDVLDLLDSR